MLILSPTYTNTFLEKNTNAQPITSVAASFKGSLWMMPNTFRLSVSGILQNAHVEKKEIIWKGLASETRSVQG